MLHFVTGQRWKSVAAGRHEAVPPGTLGLARAANVFAGHPFNAIMKPLLMPYVISRAPTIGLGNILGSLRAPVKQ